MKNENKPATAEKEITMKFEEIKSKTNESVSRSGGCTGARAERRFDAVSQRVSQIGGGEAWR
jgi:hypothetical protein